MTTQQIKDLVSLDIRNKTAPSSISRIKVSDILEALADAIELNGVFGRVVNNAVFNLSGNVLIGSSTDNGDKVQVTGNSYVSGRLRAGAGRFVTGVSAATFNDTNTVKLSTGDNSGFLLQFGVSTVGKGGFNQGYGYIQGGFIGGSVDNPLIFQPLGGANVFGPVEKPFTWKTITKNDFAIENADLIGNTNQGRLAFTNPQSGRSASFIQARYDRAGWYSGSGLGFYTIGGADVSGSDGVIRMYLDSDGSLLLGGGGYAIASSALFEMQSTTKGFLPPRMTTAQINAIASPVEGLFAYSTDADKYKYYNGSAWVDVGNTDDTITKETFVNVNFQKVYGGAGFFVNRFILRSSVALPNLKIGYTNGGSEIYDATISGQVDADDANHTKDLQIELQKNITATTTFYFTIGTNSTVNLWTNSRSNIPT